MSEFPIFDVAAGGMAAERGALDLLARNVAAAQASGAEGFTRFVPVVGADAQGVPQLAAVHGEHANAGDAVTEMMAILEAQRAYEGDASMFAAGKHLAERTIDLDRS